jgi:hypothetical protein
VGWYIYLFLLMSFEKRNLNEFCLVKSASHVLYLHNIIPYTSTPILLINDLRSVRSRSVQHQQRVTYQPYCDCGIIVVSS